MKNKSINSCELAQQLINQLLDQRLDPNANANLQQHTKTCQPCQSLLQQYSIFSSDRLFEPTMSKPQRPTPTRVVVDSHRRQFALPAIALALACLVLFYVNTVPNPNDSRRPLAGRLASVPKPASETTVSDLAPESYRGSAGPVERIGSSNVSLTAAVKFPSNLSMHVWSSPDNSDLVDWDGISKNLSNLQPVLDYSRRLPVVSSFSNTVQFTWGLIQASQTKSVTPHQSRDGSADINRWNLINRAIA